MPEWCGWTAQHLLVKKASYYDQQNTNDRNIHIQGSQISNECFVLITWYTPVYLINENDRIIDMVQIV